MSSEMQAIIYEKFRPPEVLHLENMEKPSPNQDEVLIKILATTVTKYDCWMRSCTAPAGFNLLMRIYSGSKPKQPILGTELAGVVEEVGRDASRLKPGDRVFAYPGMKLGAYAEYICLPEAAAVLIPDQVTFEQAASVLQGALTALYFLRKAHLERGQKILIFGASGGVGGYAVQLAKNYFGAEVTGVCSTEKLAYVKSLGADHVIDYTKEDFTQNSKVYDVIFDTVGKNSFSRSKKGLKEKGSYLAATFGLLQLAQLVWLSRTSGRNVELGTFEEKIDDLIFHKDLIETGVISPIINRCFPL